MKRRGKAIERQYRRVREATVDEGDAREWILVQASRELQREEARRALTGSRRREALRTSVTRMTDDDLDTAWRAALRGDLDLALDRFSPHVRREVRRRKHKGTPWRQSGWLGKRE